MGTIVTLLTRAAGGERPDSLGLSIQRVFRLLPLWLLAVGLFLPIPSIVSAQETGQAAERPALTAVRLTSPPRIDGRLDDAVWTHANRITRFVQLRPVEGQPSSEPTEVIVGYDADRIYIGIYARYGDPSLVRANRSDRDQTASDDTVTVSFDPFQDAQRAYAFSVNAYGVQTDALLIGAPSGVTTDTSWNALYESAGMLVADGWTAEMAIPVRSLRYPGVRRGEAHRWAFQVQREIKSRSETSMWAPVSGDVMAPLGLMGTIEGLRDLSTTRTFELLPTATSVRVEKRQPAGGSTRAAVHEAGLNVKFGVTSNLTLDMTVNPDFSQIESDRPQIEVNQRFPLFFAELRPFFLEGQDIFTTNGPFPYLHTRTIVDPLVGARLTGKVGKTVVGVLVANDTAPGRVDDPSDPAFGRHATIAVVRLRRDIYRESSSGILLIDREFLGAHSRVGVFDNTFRLGTSNMVAATAVLTDHRDRASVARRGHFLDFAYVHQNRRVRMLSALHSVSPDFRNDSGFVQRTDARRWFNSASYLWWPESWMTNWGPRGNYERFYDYRGVLTDEIRGATLNALLASSVSLSATVSRNMERFGGVAFEKTRASATARVDTSRRLSLSVDWNRGDEIRFVDQPFLGRTRVVNAALTIRPSSRLQAELRLNTTQFVDPRTRTEVFDIKVLDARTTYQLTERLLVRTILAANTLDRTMGVNLLGTYRVNAGTVFFAGYDDRYRQGDRFAPEVFRSTEYQRINRAVFVKLQYLYRRQG